MASKKKKVSFRQRLRNDAQKELAVLVSKATNALSEIAQPAGLTHISLAKLLSGNQTKTLEENAVTTIANRKEAELEEIYNTQLGLLDEEKSDGKG